MSDFTTSRTYMYVAGAIINPTENTRNEDNIYNAHNGAFNALIGHGHTGSVGDGPPLLPGYFNNSVKEIASANYPYTPAAGECEIACDTSAGTPKVVITDPWPAAKANRITVFDSAGNAGTRPIEIQVMGYGIDAISGVDGSVWIIEDYGSITIEKLSSGYWKIV